MNHLAVLDEMVCKYKTDENVLALAVFGSVANGTFHPGSDIDLYLVCKKFEKGYEFSTRFVHDIKVGYSIWSYDRFLERVSTTPYRMYVFAHARILIDKKDIIDKQKTLLEYFASHPEVQKEWDGYNEIYEKEKRLYGEGKTSIFDVYEKLEKKFGA